MADIPSAIPLEKIPQHVAMIMDGNGRWAIQRGLPRLAGHKAGTENLRRVIRASVEFGVKYLTIYAFKGSLGEGLAAGLGCASAKTLKLSNKAKQICSCFIE